MRFLLPFIFLSTLWIASCKPQQRAIQNYLEDMTDTTMRKDRYVAEPIIQKNDLLHIRISSASLDPTVDELYNLRMTTGGGGQNMQLQGYLVDQQGNIELPRLGVIKAEGLTKNQLAQIIKERLQGELMNPTVLIRFLNFRVSILGEVNAPGVQSIPAENLTILEALAMAGDITEFGKKKEVKVVRENDGKRQMGIVDVTSTSMFQSPYYQLQQNDVVLVEATRYKVRRTEQQRVSQQVGFALSIITSITLIYSIFNR